VTQPIIDTINWTKGLDKNGAPLGDPVKYPSTDGVLVSPASGGATNWPMPSFDPQTGLLYVGTTKSYSMFYLTDTDPRPEGWGGVDRQAGSEGGALLAIDYKTGKPAWRHDWPSGNGVVSMLTTAGKLLFTSNGNNVIAFQPESGKILWHSGLTAGPSAGMITYMNDGRQYLLVAAGDTLFAFALN
jgi:alcohol dehydrogenase (cytochrome c)